MAWYEYPSNFSNGTEVNGTGSFIKYASSVTGDWLATAFILIIFVTTFGLSLASGNRKAMAVAGFISFIFSVYFVRLALIPLYIPITLIIITFIGILGSKSEGY